MSIVVNVNGESINYPQTGDTNWGDEATDFAVQTSSALAKVGLSTGTTVDLPGTLDVTGNTTLDANLSVGGNASITGTTSLTGNVTLTNNLTVNGNTQLGNANTDTIEVTGIVNVDSGVLYVDPVNNRVGINDTTPSEALDVIGNAAISGNGTIGGTLGVSDGTALAPSITPSSDTNTGFYKISADKMGFSANGVRQGEFGVGYGGFTGNIIQLQNLTNTFSQTNTTTSSYSDVNSATSTPWEITITPRYTNSKIIIFYVINCSFSKTSSPTYGGFRIDRKIGTGAYSSIYENQRDSNGPYNFGLDAIGIFTNAILMYVDEPSTTSICTYKLLSRPYSSGDNVIINIAAGNSSGKSYVTVQEVQQ